MVIDGMVPWPIPRPTLRGWCALGALVLLVVIAASTTTPELAPLIVITAVPLLAGPWMARRRARRLGTWMELHAHLDPPMGAVGCTMDWVLAVTNHARRVGSLPPAGLLLPSQDWRFQGDESFRPVHRRWLAPSVHELRNLPVPAPGVTEQLALPVPTSRRGLFETGPRSTWTHDTFGFFGAPGPETPGAVIVIHPVPVAPVEPHATMGSDRGGSTEQHARRGSELGDLEGIRPYVSGDRLSLVHWPARARYGAWFVRQFSAEHGDCFALAIDDRAGVHHRDAFERMTSNAMWMVEDAIRAGYEVDLYLISGAHCALTPSLQDLALARRVLAGIAPQSGHPARPTPTIPSGSLFLTTSTGALQPPQNLQMQLLVSDAFDPIPAVRPIESAML
jgi:uncharacterized protein (DUF58 family)